MRNVTEIQRYLIWQGYLAATDEHGKPNDDGKFGTTTLAAYNRARAAKGEPPHTGLLLLTEVNADLFGEETAPQPKPKASNPISDYLTGIAVKAVLSKLKGLPMLNGYKTYIIGGMMVLLGIVTVIGFQIPGVPVGDGMKLVMDGFAFMFLRAAVNKVPGQF
jgi:hypothetical protein